MLYYIHQTIIKKIYGLLNDLEEAALIRNQQFSKNIDFLPTNRINDIANSNLVIICAGLFANQEEKTKYTLTDLSGRHIQAYKNFPIINNLCEQINLHTPNTSVIIITNQVDIMSEIARKKLHSAKVYGLGCYLDTIRFKKIFSTLTHLKQSEFDAVLLGFHNQNLFIQDASFQISSHLTNIETYKKLALQKTINRGKEISDMQKDIHHPNINSGSSKLPAAALFNIIAAFTQTNTKKIIIPLNRRLDKENISTAAQALCQISYNSITHKYTELSANNLSELKKGIEIIHKNIKFIQQLHTQSNNRGKE
ncbi:MAG: hypothetical protein J6C85_00885 [Alphaproteobacteria bacterium]|nr:hypothetical protein [Alphaproteobacteria bacterium]